MQHLETVYVSKKRVKLPVKKVLHQQIVDVSDLELQAVGVLATCSLIPLK
jgi:hypothetical protein